MEKNQAELTEMEKDIYGIERKYSLYYKEKKSYNTLYYIFSVFLSFGMGVCIGSFLEFLTWY